MQIHREPYKGVYGLMDFPAYQFHEFPKAVRVVRDGKIVEVVAQNQADELRIKASSDLAPLDPAVVEKNEALASLVKVDEEKRMLEDRNLHLEAELSKLKDQVAQILAAQAQAGQAQKEPSVSLAPSKTKA